MTAEHSSEEGGEGLSEAERKMLNGPLVSMMVANDGVPPTLYAAVERILADRLAAVQAERDDLRGRLAAVGRLRDAAEWRAEHSLSRTFTGEPFPALVSVDELTAALANSSAAQGEGEA